MEFQEWDLDNDEDFNELINKVRAGIRKDFKQYSPRELATYFSKGYLGSEEPKGLTTQDVENMRMIIRDYLSGAPEEFLEEFRNHLDDRLLGERSGDLL